jgi:GT2 family glycosyltransferase
VSQIEFQATIGLVLVFAITAAIIYKVRKGSIGFRYAVFWMVVPLLGLVALLLTPTAGSISTFLQISPAALVSVSSIVVLIAVTLQLSSAMSHNDNHIRRLSEEIAKMSMREHERYSQLTSSLDKNLNIENVLVVIPAYNEGQSIGFVLNELRDFGYKTLVIDDGSSDDTAEIARERDCLVVSLPFNMGVGAALRVGFQVADEKGFLAVVQIDADGQHPVDEIANLIAESNLNGAHLVIGSRFLVQPFSMRVSRTRRLVMRLMAYLATKAAGTRVTDSSSGFRLIRRPLLEQLAIRLSDDYLGDTYEALVAAGRSGYKIVEIPANIIDRHAGRSSASMLQACRFTLKSISISLLRLHQKLDHHS